MVKVAFCTQWVEKFSEEVGPRVTFNIPTEHEQEKKALVGITNKQFDSVAGAIVSEESKSENQERKVPHTKADSRVELRK